VLLSVWQAGLRLGGPNAEYLAAIEFLVGKKNKYAQKSNSNNNHHLGRIVIAITGSHLNLSCSTRPFAKATRNAHM